MKISRDPKLSQTVELLVFHTMLFNYNKMQRTAGTEYIYIDRPNLSDS